jgi:hypothetical protein
MENDIRWPKKGDNPFSSKHAQYRSPTWCSLNWLSNFNLDDSYYADAFKKAADKIISELERGENYEHADPMFIPIAYLYRHSLELKIKSVIRKGIDLKIVSLERDKITELLESHSLHKIWNTFKTIVMTHWPEGNMDELNATENVIIDFHNVDKSGQHLRYSKDKKGNKTSTTLPDSVELTNLKDTFDGVYNLLDGCDMEFNHCIDMRNEMYSEYY